MLRCFSAIYASLGLVALSEASGATFHVEQSRTVSFEWVVALVEEAVQSRPEFLSLESRLQADELARQSITVWEDPIVGIGPVVYDSDRLYPSQFGDIGYSFRQSLPKRREKVLLLEGAEVQTESTRIERAISRVNLQKELYQALVQKAEVAEALEIQQDDLRWIRTMVTRKEDRFKVQQAGHDELMALQNERGLHELKLELATNELKMIDFRIRRLLNYAATNDVPDVRLPIPLTPIPFGPDLIRTAKEQNPELKWLRNAITGAENESEKTELDQQPRWSLQAEARQYSGDGGFREGAFRVGLSLPWINRKERLAGVRSKQERVEAARQRFAEAEARMMERLHALTLEMDGVDRSLRVHRDEIQLRRQEIAASAQSAWEVNRGSLDELLNQRRNLIGDRLKVVQYTARLHHLAAEILAEAGISRPGELSP